MLTIRTNNVPRPILDGCELTPDERAEFDYLNWEAINEGSDSASFFRYKGTAYDLGEFIATRELLPWDELRAWDGYMSDSFFSGLAVRFTTDYEQVIVATYLS